MKYLIAFFLGLILLGCQTPTKTQKPSFILGEWQRLNNLEDKKTYEFWNDDFTGKGYTLQGKDTVFKEILSIVSVNDTLFYRVVSVNSTPTLFQFTSQTDSSFVCENSKNEFPKKISYWRVNDTLKARVSNPDFGIDFVFVKNN